MKTRLFLTSLVILLGFNSCNEDRLSPTNPNQLGAETFYRTGPQLVAAINSVYAGLQANNLYNREYFFLQDLLSDDCGTGGPQLEGSRAQVLNHVFDASNPLVEANWRGWYRVIHRANLVLENADTPKEEITEELRNRIKGEAYFLRALAHYELVTQWGGVPLMLTSATSPDGVKRSTPDEVYSLIFADLGEATGKLPLRSAYSGTDRGRASKGSAQALAAKAHLFRGNYTAARPFLVEIVTSNQYRLVDRYLDNFEEENENNAESVWEIQFSEAFGAAGAWNGNGNGIAEVTFRGQEYGPTAWRNVIPSLPLFNAYERVANGAAKDDPRIRYSFYQLGDTFNGGNSIISGKTVQGDTLRASWRKYQMIYKRPAEDVQSGINFRAIRYADVLLMMAEVENELSGPSVALPFINQVRARADVAMPPYPTAQYPTGTKLEMLRAIQHERRVELAGEQIRNKDIRRWRAQNLLASEPISNWNTRYTLLPIPLSEIDNNSALTNSDQNPGY